MFGKCIENKIDLEDKREILKEEGLKKAEDLRCSFIETSTLHNINVQLCKLDFLYAMFYFFSCKFNCLANNLNKF